MTRSTEPEANENPCERTEPLLSAYLLEELADGERDAVASHLATCTHCREELEMLSSAASVLRSIPPLEAGLEPAERERILAAARESVAASRGARSRVIYLALGGLAAAAVLVALVVPGIIPFEREKAIELARAPEPVKAAVESPDFETLLDATGPLPREPGRQVAIEETATLGAPPTTGALETRPLFEGQVKELETSLGIGPKDALEKKDAFFVSPDGTTRPIELAYGEGIPEAARPLSAGEDSRRLARSEEESRTNLKLAERLTEMEQLRREAETPVALQKAKKAGYGSGAPARPEGIVTNRAVQDPQEVSQLTSRSRADSAERFLRGDSDPAAPSRVYRSNTAAEPARESKLEGTGGGAAGAYGARWSPAKRGGANGTPAGPAAQPPVDPATVAPTPPAAPAAAGRAAPATPASLADKPAEAPAQGVPATAAPSPADGLQEKLLASPEADRLAAAPAEGGGATTATVSPTVDWRARVDEFLSRLDRRPGETPGMMFFRYWGTNPFVEASSDPLSTFAVDVDTASYTLARAYFYQQGMLPPREAIRTEEFINFFKSRYAPPAADGPAFAVHAEMAPSPFAHEPDYQILKVGLKGREVTREKRKACGLVFVIDTSGSMRQGNRLELVKEALRLLVPELDEGDTVGIVAFDREARVILDPMPASEKERILDAISRLEPRQNTNVAAGLEMGYQMAARHKVKDGSNRVLLLSDGVANQGNVDPDAMTEKVRAEREQGIYLTCVGVGMGNMNDSLMERLADRGNGQCVYVDRIEQAKKAFVENLTGTLEAVAKDAKIQVEFDPAKVLRYRLLGYENRDIADAQFRDNKVDAGEVGAGHEVTALYELKLKPDAADTLATIRVRYLTVDHGEAVEIARPVTSADRRKALSDASPRFQVSACAAELAEVLRGSYWARGNTLDKVAAILEPILGAEDRSNPDGPSGGKLGDDNDVVELVALVKKADALVRERDARADDIARTSDAIKENYILRAQIEDALRARAIDNRAQIDDILQQNEALRRRLEDLLRR